MRRVVIQLYEAASAPGGAVDTGVLVVEEFEAITVAIKPSGAVSGAYSGVAVGESGDEHVYVLGTGVAAGVDNFVMSIGPGMSGAAIPGPTRRMRWRAASSGAGTIHMEIQGIKYVED